MIIIGITKYFSHTTRQVSLPHDHTSNGFFTKKGRVCLVKFFVIVTSRGILRNNLELPVFYNVRCANT